CLHQKTLIIAELLGVPPDPLESQFRASYTTLLNLLDAFGNFARVREIAEQSFAHSGALPRIHEFERTRDENGKRIREKLASFPFHAPSTSARGLERLANARSPL